MSRKRKQIPQASILACLAIAALTIALYLPGLKGGFLFDDYGNIVDNVSIQIQHLNSDTLRSSLSGPKAGPLGRPVSVLSFALTHYYFGLNPFAYKAINLATHLINGLLVAWLTALLIKRQPNNLGDHLSIKWLPIWVAAVWLLHPINSVPILLAVQRMTLLSGMFLLLAMIFHLKGISTVGNRASGWGWLTLGWLVCWPLAILSKETGLLFPLFVLLMTFLSLATRPSRNHRKQVWPIAVLFLILSLVVIAMVNHLGIRWLEGAYAMRSFSLSERIMTELRVLWFYASQILIPSHTAFGLYLDDIQISHSLLDPYTTLTALIGWAAAAIGIIFGWRRWPIPCFALAWFLAGHALESTFLPLEIAHEYRNYIPSLGLILGTGYLGSSVLNSFKLDHPRLTTSLAALLPIVLLSSITWMRANQWSDTLVGLQLEAMHHPHSSRTHYTAAKELFGTGHGDANDPIGGQMISYHFNKAAEIDPNEKMSYLGLIYWACASSRPIEQVWINELEKRLRRSRFTPNDLNLPQYMLKLILNNTDCLSRQQTTSLLTAGGANRKVPLSVRSAFYNSAADYELLVSKDIPSAIRLLRQAIALAPSDRSLQKKVNGLETVKVR